MSVDVLQKVFKTLTDPTRIRILALLEREELAVQDLVEILGTAQSTVSRHLSILRESGLLRDRKVGTYAYYRFVAAGGGPWREAWDMTRKAMEDDPIAAQDSAALEVMLRERSVRSQSFFDSIGPRWDEIRTIFNDDVQRARAIAKLLPANLRVADIGTGTGVLAHELARSGVDVIAIDHSRRMLSAAADKLSGACAKRVEFRHGDATDLPLAAGEVDAAFAHMVLHYVASPIEAIREMARVVRPGGRVVIVDFVETEGGWMKEELELTWPGFPVAAMREWFEDAGLLQIDIEVCEPQRSGSELPATFIASAHRSSDPLDSSLTGRYPITGCSGRGET